MFLCIGATATCSTMLIVFVFWCFCYKFNKAHCFCVLVLYCYLFNNVHCFYVLVLLLPVQQCSLFFCFGATATCSTMLTVFMFCCFCYLFNNAHILSIGATCSTILTADFSLGILCQNWTPWLRRVDSSPAPTRYLYALPAGLPYSREFILLGEHKGGLIINFCMSLYDVEYRNLVNL